MLLNLANALNTTTDYLVGRVVDPMPEKETLEANFLFFDKENLTEEDEEYLNMIAETMKKRRANSTKYWGIYIIINDYLLSDMEELAVKFYDRMNITKPNPINPECLAEYFDIDFEKDKKKSLYAEFGGYKLIHVSDQYRHSSESHWQFAYFLLAHKELIGESVDSTNHRSNE